jgi:hypothetical protein
MNREEWLKSLKIGDKVADKNVDHYSSDISYSFYTIKSITKKGNIRLDNGILLNSDGKYYKFENWHSTSYNIEPITEELLEEIKLEKEKRLLINKIDEAFRSRKHKNISIEKLRELNDLLENE